MYFPKNKCTVSSTVTDVFGKEQITATWPEKCAIVSIVQSDEKTPVRTDTSATRGNAKELISDAIILLGPKSKVKMSYVLQVEGFKLSVVGIQPRFNIDGRLDHYEVNGDIWKEKQSTSPDPKPPVDDGGDKWN